MTVAPSAPDQRLGFLDALRGVAAMQVVLLHIVTALAPGLALSGPDTGTLAGRVHASPLFLLYDGYSAVYLFFILSGYVLTLAFANRTGRPLTTLAGRLVRLGLPALAACSFSALLFLAFGGANVLAGELVQSNWYKVLWQPQLGLAAVVKDALLYGLLTGYAPVEPWMSLIPAWRGSLASYSAPLWTLSVEVYGSVLVFLLVAARRHSRWLWLALLVLAVPLLLRGPYLCFLAGHLMARLRLAEGPPRLPALLAAALAACGFWLCAQAEFGMVAPIQQFCTLDAPMVPCSLGGLQQKIYGSLLVFLGLIQLDVVRGVLRAGWAAWLGRVSFSLYLTHWPLLFGPGAALFLAMHGPLGLGPARWLAMGAVLMASLLVARAFQPVDQWSIRLSRATQRQGGLSRS